MDGKKSLRNLILLLQGQFVTNIGNRIYDIAMLLWIKELTGSAAIMGLAMLVTNLPEAVLAPMGGKIADRYGKVRCIVTTDLISAVAVGVLVAVMLLIDSTTVFIIALCAVNLVLGMSSSCFIPAVSSLIPDLVPEEHLERGNAAQQFSQTGAKAIGQGIGGLVFSLFGALGAFAINAVTFLLSAVSESFIRVPERKVIAETEGVASSLMHQTVDVLRYLWRENELRRIVLYIAAFHLFLSCLPVLLPFYAEHALSISDRWFGFFIAAYTVGILAGFLLSGVIKSGKNRFFLIAAAGAAVGAMFWVVGTVSSYWFAWPALFGIGAGIGLIVVNLMTELQIKSAPEERGGIMGSAHAVGGCTFPIGMAVTGLLIDTLHGRGLDYGLSVRAILISAGIMAFLLSVATLLRMKKERVR